MSVCRVKGPSLIALVGTWELIIRHSGRRKKYANDFPAPLGIFFARVSWNQARRDIYIGNVTNLPSSASPPVLMLLLVSGPHLQTTTLFYVS